MKILVTGGCGYIGSALIQRLANKGKNELFSLDVRLPLGLNDYESRVSYIEQDLSDPTSLALKINDIDPDVVVHLAAKISGSATDIIKANVLGTSNLLDAVRSTKLRLFIASSTSAQLYRNAQYVPIDEKHPVTPVTPYGLSKYLMEEIIAFHHRVNQTPSLILRQTNIYGSSPNRKTTVINRFIEQAFTKGKIEIYGDGKQVRNFLYLEDLVEYYVRAIYHRSPSSLSGEILNIAGPREYQIKTVSKKLAKIFTDETGKQVKIEHVPLEIPPAHEIYLFKVSTEKARRLLGYEAKTTIEEAARKIIREYPREHV